MNKIKTMIVMFVMAVVLCACTPQPAPSQNSYIVNFFDQEENLLASLVVKSGEKIESPTAPEIKGYEFVGWDQDITNITSDLNVHPLYEVKKYSVKFLDHDGKLLKEELVEHGKSATAPSDPVREDYLFTRWNRLFSKVEEDMEITAIYRIVNCTVTFVDHDGTVLKEEKVEVGQSATAPKNPSREGYKFIGWNTSLTNIRNNLTITAQYEFLATSGTVTFYDGKTVLDLSPSEYDFGESFVLPIPEKEGYAFVGWYLAERSLTEYTEVTSDMMGDLTFYARWVETERNIVLPEATYHFTELKKNYNSSTGVTTINPIMPSGAPSGVTNYDWSTSNSKVATVSTYSSISAASNGYCILTAKHKTSDVTINCVIKVTSEGISCSTVEEANNVELCNVTFVGKDGEAIKEIVCPKGETVIYPAAPTYDGYKFVGWSHPNTNIQSDVVIEATYELGVNNYAGKSFAIIGDSISTFKNYIPSGFASFYPYPTADVNDVNKTWWMQAINKIGGTLFSNNSYSGTCVAPNTGNETSSKARLEHTLLSDQVPDVILIFIGANDCASKYVDYSEFYRGYKMMLDHLQILCPESELVLCTLPTSPFYSDSERTKFNNGIREYAETYDLKLVEIEGVSLAGHLVDSAHPNTSGMTLVAEAVVQGLLEENEN